MRKTIPKTLLALSALLLIVNFFFNVPTIRSFANLFKSWMVILTTTAMIIAILNVVARVGLNVIRKGPRWNYQIIQIAAFLLFVVVGLSTNLDTSHSTWKMLNSWLRTPISRAMVATVALSLLAGISRAFVARNAEAAVLLGSGIFAILMNATMLERWTLAFFNFGNWLMDYPMTAGQRGMLITAGLGLIALGIRTLLGFEKGVIGGSEE